MGDSIMHPFEVKKDIHWVGAIDWHIRDFHGYSTPKGTRQTRLPRWPNSLKRPRSCGLIRSCA